MEATLSALRECMVQHLSHGNRFYIRSIGYFLLLINLNMPEDKASADYISVRNIISAPMLPCCKVKRNVHFERAKFSTKSREHTEEMMLEGIKEYLSINICTNHRAMEKHFGLRQNSALKWLKHFTEIGVLRKEGARNSPVYFMNL